MTCENRKDVFIRLRCSSFLRHKVDKDWGRGVIDKAGRRDGEGDVLELTKVAL